MDNPKAIMGAAAGVGVGLILWAILSFAMGMELAILALLVGLAAGGGMRLMSRTKKGVEIGVIAALITFVALFVGKGVSSYLVTQRQLLAVNATKFEFTDDQMMIQEAKPIMSALVRRGVKLAWRNGKNATNATSIEDYPLEIANQAKDAWNKRSDKEKLKKDAADQEHRVQFGAVNSQREGAFWKSFGLLDLIWFGGALAGAFFLGAGSLKASDDEDEDGFIDDGTGVIRAHDADD
jgi:hypothetical protein